MLVTELTPSLTVRLDGAILPPEVAASITDVNVTNVLNAMDSFELTLVNPYPALPWTTGAGELLLREGGEIAIALGYLQDAPPLIEGIITALRAQFADESAPTLTVSGYNRLYALQGRAGAAEFVDATDSQIVTQLAVRAGLAPQVSATEVIYPSVWQTGQTDLAFVLERARRLDYEVTASGRTLIFRPHNAEQQVSCSLVWGQPRLDIGPLSQSAPLQRLDVDLSLADQVSGVRVYGIDPASGEPIVGLAGTTDEPDTPPLVVFSRPVVSLDEARALAQAIFSQRRRRLVTISGATVGLPRLRPGQIVQLEGVGRFNGRYYLTETTHTLGDDGYHTSFRAEQEPAL